MGGPVTILTVFLGVAVVFFLAAFTALAVELVRIHRALSGEHRRTTKRGGTA